MDIIRSWREQKAMLKMRFPTLTDRDFDFKDDDRDGMLQNLATKLQKSKVEIQTIFTELQGY